MLFSARCFHDDRGFWIYGVFGLALALSLAAVVLAVYRSPFVSWFAIGGVLLGLGVVGIGEVAVSEALPSGGGVSPDVQRFFREQEMRREGKEAFERNLQAHLAGYRSECRGVCIRSAAIPLLITVAALGIRRARTRAARA
jgi:hypothetical protein